jgi:serine/threonine-protein kinase HipA
VISVGSSVGGARAKAVVAWNRETDEFRPGQVELPQGFEQWIIKLDEEGESKGYGRIEHAYHLMAVAAGIDMSECRLHLEGGRAHFMTRRFDRTPAGDKIHMQTLGAMAHFDFNMPRANSYEQAFEVLRALGLGRGVAEELFRRMAFNVVARNQDDHVKNISFLMDRSGSWRLSPAYDVTYSVGGGPTAYHQMTINGKFEGFGLDDFKACAQMAGLKRGRAEAILEQVGVAVLKWPSFSAVAEIPVHQVERIAKAHRIFLW